MFMINITATGSVMRHWDHPLLLVQSTRPAQVPSQRDRSAEDGFCLSRLRLRIITNNLQRAASPTARNLSRILGLNDLSSASVSNPSSINSEGIEDKTLMTAPR